MPTKDDQLTITDITLKEDAKTKVRRRCPKVEIVSPVNEVPLIIFHQEDVVEINLSCEASKPAPPLVLSFADVQADMLEVTDPVTGKVNTVSMAFIAQCIRAKYILATKADLKMS